MGVYWLRFLRKDGGEIGGGLVVPRVIGSHSKFRLDGVPGERFWVPKVPIIVI